MPHVTRWLEHSPPDGSVWAASHPIVSTFSDAGFVPTAGGRVELNGQLLFTFEVRNITGTFTNDYTFEIGAALRLDPITGNITANDYTVTPIHGWPVGDNVFHIEGELLSTTYEQDRNFTVLETDYDGFWNETSKNRLIEQFKDKVLIEGWLDAYTNQVQELEDALEELLYQTNLENARGEALDRLGEILNVPRDGRLDDWIYHDGFESAQTYRDEIFLSRDILVSDGTESAIVDVFLRLVKAPDTTDVEWDEAFPKAVVLRARDHESPGTDSEQDAILDRLQQAAPAGTELEYVYTLTQASDDDIFHFSTVADTTQTSVTYGTENGDLCGAAI